MSTLKISKYAQATQNQVLVLLHGWGSSSKIWQNCIDELQEYFQIWCIDLPGHGQNQSVCWDASTKQGIQLLAETLPNSCTLIGWSLGGLLAQLYTDRYPQRVDQLMLIASTPKFLASQDWPHGMSQETFKNFAQKFKHTAKKTLQEFSTIQTLGSLGAKRTMQILDSAATPPKQSIAWGLEWLTSIDMRNSKALENKRIHLLHGAVDQVCSVKAAQDTAQIWNKVRLCSLAKAGHAPFLSHQDRFLQQIRTMMKIHNN